MRVEDIRTFEDVLRVFGAPAVLTTVARAHRPIVYVVASDEGRVVEYVGSSTVGLDRAFDARHHALRDCDGAAVIAVWSMPSARAARLVEDALIARLAPRRNRQRTTLSRVLESSS